MKRYPAGQAVTLWVEIRDGRSLGEPLMNPSVSTTITIRNPAGTAVATTQAMTNVSTGLYQYTHQTAGGDVKGVYTGHVVATDDVVGLTDPLEALFELF